MKPLDLRLTNVFDYNVQDLHGFIDMTHVVEKINSYFHNQAVEFVNGLSGQESLKDIYTATDAIKNIMNNWTPLSVSHPWVDVSQHIVDWNEIMKSQLASLSMVPESLQSQMRAVIQSVAS